MLQSVSQKQLDFLNSPKTQRDLKEGFMELQNKFLINPTMTEQEFERVNEYLEIDKNKTFKD